MQLTETQRILLTTIRDFVNKEVIPTAREKDVADEYPYELVERTKEFGLLGAFVPEEYGGLGLDYRTYALIIEEICRGWMSLGGMLNAHVLVPYMITVGGTDAQKREWLPKLATGEYLAALANTEPDAGNDVAAIQTSAVRRDDHYVLNGYKSIVSNGIHANVVMVMAKTDPQAGKRGISAFLCPKGEGLNVVRKLPTLGARGHDTAELALDDYNVPAENLVGGEEGKGFSLLLNAGEVGRINVAASALGIARAAYEAAIQYAQKRQTFGKPIAQHQAIQLMLADMATQMQAGHLLTMHAAEKKDSGERCDLEVSMAKLFASEICLQVSLNAMRIHGGYGFMQDLPVERYYRDAPFMVLGVGTNEIIKLVIARSMLTEFPTGDFIGQQLFKPRDPT